MYCGNWVTVVALIFALPYSYAYVSGKSNLYFRNTQYDGFTCRLGDLMVRFENVKNRIACIARCAQQGCVGVFYHPGSKLCEGCFTFYGSSVLPAIQTTDSRCYQPFIGCPGSSVRYNRSCYAVTTSKMTWNSASNYCRSIHGNLATLENAGEDSFVGNWLISSGVGNMDDRVYFGATDSGSEGNWMNIYGDRQKYLNWGDGQPGRGLFGLIDEDCASVNTEDRKWNDIPCGETHLAICEIDLI